MLYLQLAVIVVAIYMCVCVHGCTSHGTGYIYIFILSYREAAVTQVTFSEPAENNVQLLNTSVVSTVTAYENLDFDDNDKDDVDYCNFMTQDNFDAKKKRRSRRVLEITADPEIV